MTNPGKYLSTYFINCIRVMLFFISETKVLDVVMSFVKTVVKPKQNATQ